MMETVLDSNTSPESSISQGIHIKAASVPVAALKPNEKMVKVQISAPSYLNSLKENDAPPFKKPDRETRPRLLIGTIMNEEEVVEMVAATVDDGENGGKLFLG
jgi:hypothetical protein